MGAITIRPRVRDDDPQIVRILNAIQHDMPPWSVEEQRHYIDSFPAEAGSRHLVAERDGAIVGTAGWNRRIYTTVENSYRCGVSVHPDHRGQGIGSSLYEECLTDLQNRGARRAVAHVREDDPGSERFARSRGFERSGYADRASRLEVQTANLDRSRLAAVAVAQSGVTLISLAELKPDEAMLRAICDVDNASTAAMPSSEEWRPMPFEEWKRYVLEGPGYLPEAFFVALDGDQPVGVAWLEKRSGGFAENGYTGVHPRYHGRGIARALKLRTVEWAQANDIEYIVTGNDVHNAPMLRINDEIGYQPLPAHVEMVKTL